MPYVLLASSPVHLRQTGRPQRVDISPGEKTPLTENIATRVRARRLIGHSDRDDKRVRELENELQAVRRALVKLMPTEIADLLLSHHSCESQSDFASWRATVIERVCEVATPELSQSFFQERAYCPLCRQGSSWGYSNGFTLPEGLRRHLIGFGRTSMCPVTEAAFYLASDYLQPRFAEIQAAEERVRAERRNSERLYLVDLDSPPKLLDEFPLGYSYKARSPDGLAAAEERLHQLGFETQLQQNVICYKLEHGVHTVLADPRPVGRIDFVVHAPAGPDRKREKSQLFLLDSWRKELASMFHRRLKAAVDSLCR